MSFSIPRYCIALGQEAMTGRLVLGLYIAATAFSNRPLVLFSNDVPCGDAPDV